MACQSVKDFAFLDLSLSRIKISFHYRTILKTNHFKIQIMEIKKSDDKHKGMFYMEDQGKRIAYMTFTYVDDKKFSIDHTVVEPGNEGKGLGKKLVAAGVEFARENNYKIQPLCSYAKAVMEKIPEYADVLINENTQS